jgi:hypothetical protein
MDDNDDLTGAADQRKPKTACKQGLHDQWDIICKDVDEEELNSLPYVLAAQRAEPVLCYHKKVRQKENL